MGNKDIRLEWVPSAYRDDEQAALKTTATIPGLYPGKGIYTKQGFKRKVLLTTGNKSKV